MRGYKRGDKSKAADRFTPSQTDTSGIATPTLLECAIVIAARLGRPSRPILERFISELNVEIVPFGAEHWMEALDAWQRFGKGRHRAALNFGVCISYAVAKLSGHPLL